MQISEIFYSIQGEGPCTGIPSIFIRLSGCHLRCVWCDSKYTWPLRSGTEMSIREIMQRIAPFGGRHIVITGGEPLLQQDELKTLLTELKSRGYYIEIETSGSIAPRLGRLVDQYNCSYKLSNSRNAPHPLRRFPSSRTYYKFVVDTPQDLKEVRQIIRTHALKKDRIILMPQGTTEKELNTKMAWLAEICKKETMRLSPRLHIHIWGNIRGV